jgi:Flp pilus assembly CpaF family ATPase
MVNGPDDVFVERKEWLERVPDVPFEGEGDVMHLIERIVGPWDSGSMVRHLGVDARLPEGSRVHTH